MRCKKIIGIIFSLIFLSFSNAQNFKVDDNLTDECSIMMRDLVQSPDDEKIGTSSKRSLTQSFKCAISEAQNVPFLKELTQQIAPSASERSLNLMKESAHIIDEDMNEAVFNKQDTLFEKLFKKLYLPVFFFIAFLVLVKYVFYNTEVAQGKKFEARYLKDLIIPIIFTVPIFGFPVYVYIILAAAITGLIGMYTIIIYGFVQLYPEAAVNNDESDTEMKLDLMSSVSILIDNDLKIQMCDLENRKKLQVNDLNLFDDRFKRVDRFNQSNVQACILEQRKSNVSWIVPTTVIMEDNFTNTTRECFIENSKIREYECGRSFVSMKNVNAIDPTLVSFFEKYQNIYKARIREIGNRIIEDSCATRTDIDILSDTTNYERYCADQSAKGKFKKNGNGSLKTYAKKSKSDDSILSDYDSLKKEIFEDLSVASKKVIKEEIKYSLTRYELQNLFFSIIDVFSKQSKFDEEYKSKVRSIFLAINSSYDEVVSFSNQVSNDKSLNLSTDNLSNTLQENVLLRQQVKEFISSSKFVITENEKILDKSCSDLDNCETVNMFPIVKYLEYADKVALMSGTTFLVASGIKAAASFIAKKNFSIAGKIKAQRVAKSAEAISTVSLTVFVIDVGFIILLKTSIIGFIAFALLDWFLFVLFFMVNGNMIWIGQIREGSNMGYAVGEFFKKCIYIMFNPMILALTFFLIMFLMSAMEAIIAGSSDYVVSLFLRSYDNTTLLGMIKIEISIFIQLILKLVVLFISIKKGKVMYKEFGKWLQIQEQSKDRSEMVSAFIYAHTVLNKSKLTK